MTRWEIIETTEYKEWLQSLNNGSKKRVDRKVDRIKQFGPTLGRPDVDHVKGSRHPNLKELRIPGPTPIRILFAFDQQRRAVLLIGGDKGERKDWYSFAIAIADELFDKHLRSEKK